MCNQWCHQRNYIQSPASTTAIQGKHFSVYFFLFIFVKAQYLLIFFLNSQMILLVLFKWLFPAFCSLTFFTINCLPSFPYLFFSLNALPQLSNSNYLLNASKLCRTCPSCVPSFLSRTWYSGSLTFFIWMLPYIKAHSRQMKQTSFSVIKIQNININSDRYSKVHSFKNGSIQHLV